MENTSSPLPEALMSRIRPVVAAFLAALVSCLGGCNSTPNHSVAPIAPNITAQPADTSVSAGQPATFSVVAAGSLPLNYQWRKNSANFSGKKKTGYEIPVSLKFKRVVFFFQAEDGIRDHCMTGVQTCALPI